VGWPLEQGGGSHRLCRGPRRVGMEMAAAKTVRLIGSTSHSLPSYSRGGGYASRLSRGRPYPVMIRIGYDTLVPAEPAIRAVPDARERISQPVRVAPATLR